MDRRDCDRGVGSRGAREGVLVPSCRVGEYGGCEWQCSEGVGVDLGSLSLGLLWSVWVAEVEEAGGHLGGRLQGTTSGLVWSCGGLWIRFLGGEHVVWVGSLDEVGPGEYELADVNMVCEFFNSLQYDECRIGNMVESTVAE